MQISIISSCFAKKRCRSVLKMGLSLKKDLSLWESALEDGNAVMGPIFSDFGDCEVIMMVGLPASGKTTWAEKWVKEHPEKRYLMLGTNLALDRMKVYPLSIFFFFLLCVRMTVCMYISVGALLVLLFQMRKLIFYYVTFLSYP